MIRRLIILLLIVGCEKDTVAPEPSLCDGLTEVELWGECYNIEETTELSFHSIGCLRDCPDILGGEIPSELDNLTNLTYLRLYNQGLTGSIPPEIGNLTNLTSLNLVYNQLGCKTFDYTDWECLEYCDGSNGCSGEIPPEIGNLTNLTELYLSSNQLTGDIPVEIGQLTNLTTLSLRDNQLTGEIPQEVCDFIESNNWKVWWTFEGSILDGNNLTNTCE